MLNFRRLADRCSHVTLQGVKKEVPTSQCGCFIIGKTSRHQIYFPGPPPTRTSLGEGVGCDAAAGECSAGSLQMYSNTLSDYSFYVQPPGLNLCWVPAVAYVASYYSGSAVTLDDVRHKVDEPAPSYKKPLVARDASTAADHCNDWVRFMVQALLVMRLSRPSRFRFAFTCVGQWMMFADAGHVLGCRRALQHHQRRLQLDCARICWRMGR